MKFLFGCIVVLVVIFGGGYVFLHLGLLSFRADEAPGTFESKIAMQAVDASTERRASDLKNPLQSTDANLLSGVRLYQSSCAGCHGDPGRPQSALMHSFYPPAPQFLEDPADMPDNENFYVIKHGIRWTGMPAWGNNLTDDEIWKLTIFLSQMTKLPPPVEQEWKSESNRALGAERK
jgi:mono/diheme cytochrome c family protein